MIIVTTHLPVENYQGLNISCDRCQEEDLASLKKDFFGDEAEIFTNKKLVADLIGRELDLYNLPYSRAGIPRLRPGDQVYVIRYKSEPLTTHNIDSIDVEWFLVTVEE